MKERIECTHPDCEPINGIGVPAVADTDIGPLCEAHAQLAMIAGFRPIYYEQKET